MPNQWTSGTPSSYTWTPNKSDLPFINNNYQCRSSLCLSGDLSLSPNTTYKSLTMSYNLKSSFYHLSPSKSKFKWFKEGLRSYKTPILFNNHLNNVYPRQKMREWWLVSSFPQIEVKFPFNVPRSWFHQVKLILKTGYKVNSCNKQPWKSRIL